MKIVEPKQYRTLDKAGVLAIGAQSRLLAPGVGTGSSFGRGVGYVEQPDQAVCGSLAPRPRAHTDHPEGDKLAPSGVTRVEQISDR